MAAFLFTRENIKLPVTEKIHSGREIQVFAARLICLGLAFLTAVMNLSAARGALCGGMVVASARETDWVHHSLEPLRSICVAIFFVSIGMLVDVPFFGRNWLNILWFVTGVLLTNTFINAGILKLLGDDVRTSLYPGALLAQIGEFSFVFVTVGLQGEILAVYGYQITIAAISVTMALGPLRISMMKYFTFPEPRYSDA